MLLFYMRNIITNASLLTALSFFLAPTIVDAEKIDEAKFNSPQIIRSLGKGPQKNGVGVKIPQAPLIVRSTPIETDVELTYTSAFKEAEVVSRCRTPCLFKIPSFAGISLRASVPNGFSSTSSPEIPNWVQGFWTNYLNPNELLYQWIQKEKSSERIEKVPGKLLFLIPTDDFILINYMPDNGFKLKTQINQAGIKKIEMRNLTSFLNSASIFDKTDQMSQDFVDIESDYSKKFEYVLYIKSNEILRVNSRNLQDRETIFVLKNNKNFKEYNIFKWRGDLISGVVGYNPTLSPLLANAIKNNLSKIQ